MSEVSSIVLFAADPTRTIAFYRALGVNLEEEDHGDGVLHAATDVGDVHFAVFPGSDDAGAEPPAPGWRASGGTFVGFYVPSLADAVESICAHGSRLLVEHQVCDWGRRVIAKDPGGRAVEINQRGHCRAGADA
ncbi:MAG: VOC family protein [Acidimicrobiales bacterium]